MTIRRKTEDDDSNSDPITGLAWPAAQEGHLHLALLRARTSGTYVGVVLVVIDDLMGIRTRRSWAAGDAVLHEVGDRIRRLLRDDDTVVRLNGDQFLVVCESITGDDDIDALVHRITLALARPMTVEGRLLCIRIQVATAHGSGTASADALVARAFTVLSEAQEAASSPST